MPEIIFRKAGLNDMENIFRLSNDPEVRKVSINKSAIVWEDHVKWYTDKIKNPSVLFLVAFTEKDSFIGQVRFDIDFEQQEALISISIIEEFRGKGLGTVILDGACRALRDNTGITKIKAYIQPDNKSSEKLFINAGFEFSGEESIKDNTYRSFLKNIP